MNRNDKFLIGMISALAKLILAIGIFSYLWVVKPVIFSGSDTALLIQRIIIEFPALLIFLVMLFLLWATNKWTKYITAKKCTNEFINHLDDETKIIISNYEDDAQKHYDMYEECRKENRKLIKENKAAIRTINAYEDLLKIFRTEHKRKELNG